MPMNKVTNAASSLAPIAPLLSPALTHAEATANEMAAYEIVVIGSILQAQQASVEKKREALGSVQLPGEKPCE